MLIVFSMERSLLIWGEAVSVEYQVDVPGQGKTQLVGHRGQHLFHWKGSVVSGSQLGGQLIGAKVVPFQPHEVALVILGCVPVFHPHHMRPSHRLLCLGSYLLYLSHRHVTCGKALGASLHSAQRWLPISR